MHNDYLKTSAALRHAGFYVSDVDELGGWTRLSLAFRKSDEGVQVACLWASLIGSTWILGTYDEDLIFECSSDLELVNAAVRYRELTQTEEMSCSMLVEEMRLKQLNADSFACLLSTATPSDGQAIPDMARAISDCRFGNWEARGGEWHSGSVSIERDANHHPRLYFNCNDERIPITFFDRVTVSSVRLSDLICESDR